MEEQDILTGDIAKKTLGDILDNRTCPVYPEPFVTGYHLDETGEGKAVFTVFDNTSGDCWVESFETRGLAIQWCLGKIDSLGNPTE